MWTDTQASRATWWFLALSGLYFLLQAAQRTWLGGALEVDEAEMLLMAQGFAWGYGPQLPLYNWAQVAAFWMFGPGTAGLAFLKDAVLWLAGAGMWFAMRAAFGSGRNAAAAALSLAFLPNILWEFQRASTHSVAVSLLRFCVERTEDGYARDQALLSPLAAALANEDALW